MKVKIHTDGACSGNPGPGGWAMLFNIEDGELKSKVSFKIDKTIELVEFDIKNFKYLPKIIGAVFSNAFRIFFIFHFLLV